jgi:hypothetical protein
MRLLHLLKFSFIKEFDPNTLRFSRFKRDMKAGAFEFRERIVIGGLYAKQVSQKMNFGTV